MTVEYVVRVYAKNDFEGNFEFFYSLDDAMKYANYFRNEGFFVRVIKRTYEVLD